MQSCMPLQGARGDLVGQFNIVILAEDLQLPLAFGFPVKSPSFDVVMTNCRLDADLSR